MKVEYRGQRDVVVRLSVKQLKTILTALDFTLRPRSGPIIHNAATVERMLIAAVYRAKLAQKGEPK